jgi:hypothetical protein
VNGAWTAVVAPFNERHASCSMCMLFKSTAFWSSLDRGRHDRSEELQIHWLPVEAMFGDAFHTFNSFKAFQPWRSRVSLWMVPEDTATRMKSVGLMASATTADFTSEFYFSHYRSMVMPCRGTGERDLTIPHVISARPSPIDFSVVRSWLAICRTQHEGKHANCARAYQQIPSLRVIDCRTRKIGDAPENCLYACLSYLWGQQVGPIEATVSTELASLTSAP